MRGAVWLYTIDDLERELTDGFNNRYRRKDVALTGILLARPEDSITKQEIIPHLSYWHYKSKSYTDFFCAGYAPFQNEKNWNPIDISIGGELIGFCETAYTEIEDRVESETGWSNLGHPCLLLANSYWDLRRKGGYFDFRRTVRIDFIETSNIDPNMTPNRIMTTVFEFAKYVNEHVNNDEHSDPIWGLSDQFGRRLFKRGLKEMLLSALPPAIRPHGRLAFKFPVYQAD
jgi:hypothetical protein